MMVNKDALIEHFSDICIKNLGGNILDKCIQICLANKIGEEELVETWTAFSAMHLGFSAPTMDTLARMEREMIQKKCKQSATVLTDSQKKSGVAKNNIILDLPAGYTTPQRAQPASRLPGHDAASSPAAFSPASYSPAILTPSAKPAAGSGKVLCEFGEPSELGWSSKDKGVVSVELLATGTGVLSTPQHYMFEPVHLSRAVLCDHIEQLGLELQKRNAVDEISPLNEPAMEEVVVVGRVACDAEDNKLTSSSVVLVGASERDEVALSLQNLPSYALFPGQVVAVRGLNQTGKQLLVSQIHANVSPPEPQQPISLQSESSNVDPLQIVVASGPFTHSDAMTYEPLHALVQYVKLHKPHVLILTGPFVDEAHQSIQKGLLENTFEEFFNGLVKNLIQPIESLYTHVVLVSSSRDAHHQAVYPTPPFLPVPGINFPAKLTLASDPCLISINGLVVGVTATDVLMHLGRCEVASQGSDRLGRLASHVLHQATFYPLYPPAQQLSLQLELWEKFAQMPVKPHMLVLPSDLRCFLKDVEGTLVVNPEHLAKGVGGGSFARLEVHQPKDEKPLMENIKAQVLKI